MEMGRRQTPNPTQPRESASIYCVLLLNLIKGMFDIAFQTHTHTHQHPSKYITWHLHPKTLAYIYHTQHPHKTQHALTIHLIIHIQGRSKQTYHIQGRIIDMEALKQTCDGYLNISFNHACSYPLSKHKTNVCSCECMHYLAYLIISQHLCINVWTYECVFMEKQRKH